MSGEESAEVTVVNVDAGGDDGGGETVVVAPDTSDPWPTIAAHGERLVAVEGGLTTLAARIEEVAASASNAQFEAELAGDRADAAVEVALDASGEVQELAAETEEAVAAVAEEADADTAKVVEEVEEIAPNRVHPWFKKRSIMADKS